MDITQHTDTSDSNLNGFLWGLPFDQFFGESSSEESSSEEVQELGDNFYKNCYETSADTPPPIQQEEWSAAKVQPNQHNEIPFSYREQGTQTEPYDDTDEDEDEETPDVVFIDHKRAFEWCHFCNKVLPELQRADLRQREDKKQAVTVCPDCLEERLVLVCE